MSEKNLLEEAKMYYKEGNCLKRKKKSEEARKKYEKALGIVESLTQQDIEIWILRGQIQSRLGDLMESEDEKHKKLHEALKIFDRAIDMESEKRVKTKEGQENDNSWNWKYHIFFKLRRYVNALKNFVRAFNTRPKSFNAWFEKGNIFFRLEEYDKSLEAFDRAVETEKGQKSDSAWNWRGRALLKLQRYVEALEDHEKAIKLNTKNFHARYNKGTVLLKLKRYEEAHKSFEEASKTKDGKKDSSVHNYKGYALLKLERYENALTDFEKAIELRQNDKERSFYVLYNKGFTLLKLERYLEALKAFNKAIKAKNGKENVADKKDKSLERTKNNIAFAYMRLGIYEKAMKTLEDAIKKNPESISHHVSLGEFFLDHGDLDNAQEEVRKALEIDALPSELKSEIKEKDYDEVRKKELKNEKIDALILEGKIKIEEKKYDEAIKSFEEAIRSGLGDSRPLFWVAYAKYLKVETSPYRKDRNSREMIEITSNLERAAYLSKRDGKKGERLHILYSLGFLYYKRKDFFKAKERLKECVSLNFKSPTESKARELLDYIWNYKIKPPWWRWWLFSPLNSLRKRIVFTFLFLIVLLTVVFHLFATELLIVVAGVWKFYIIIEYLQGFKSWQISVAIIALSVLFLIWPNVERIRIRDIGIEMSSPPSFEPDILDIEYPPKG